MPKPGRSVLALRVILVLAMLFTLAWVLTIFWGVRDCEIYAEQQQLAIEDDPRAVEFDPHVHSLEILHDQPLSRSGGYVAVGNGKSPFPCIVRVDVAVARGGFWLGGGREYYLWFLGIKCRIWYQSAGHQERLGIRRNVNKASEQNSSRQEQANTARWHCSATPNRLRWPTRRTVG